jgi:hypothetical protein
MKCRLKLSPVGALWADEVLHTCGPDDFISFKRPRRCLISREMATLGPRAPIPYIVKILDLATKFCCLFLIAKINILLILGYEICSRPFILCQPNPKTNQFTKGQATITSYISVLKEKRNQLILMISNFNSVELVSNLDF